MRYPKHPFSPDEPGAGARAESPDDQYDLTPETVPDRGRRYSSAATPHRGPGTPAARPAGPRGAGFPGSG